MRALTENAFFVLGLPTSASAMEIERETKKLLGMLKLGMAGGLRYDTPLGTRERNEALVRAAQAVLRDPQRRLVHEQWASIGPTTVTSEPAASGLAEHGESVANPEDEPDDPPLTWDCAMNALGWRRQ